MENVRKILIDILSNDLLEDRLEYSVDDLAKMYNIENDSALYLFAILRVAA